jgi:hypothetical protein
LSRTGDFDWQRTAAVSAISEWSTPPAIRAAIISDTAGRDSRFAIPGGTKEAPTKSPFDERWRRSTDLRSIAQLSDAVVAPAPSATVSIDAARVQAADGQATPRPTAIDLGERFVIPAYLPTAELSRSIGALTPRNVRFREKTSMAGLTEIRSTISEASPPSRCVAAHWRWPETAPPSPQHTI